MEQPTSIARIRDRWWALPLAAFLLFGAMFHRFWTHAAIYRDSLYLYAPHKFLVAQSYKNFSIMGWSPYQFLGLPIVGDPLAGWFYPLNLIYLVLPFEAAHRLFICIHYPLTAIFMTMLLGRLNLGKAASIFGGLVLTLSGYLVSQHGHMNMVIGMTWTPLALYGILRANDDAKSWTASIAWALTSGAALALQVLGGEPQTAANSAVMVGVFALAQLGKSWKRALLSLTIAGAFSAILAAVQVLPTYQMMQMSVRSEGIPLAQALTFSFHPLRTLEFVWPLPFGTVWPQALYWWQFVTDTDKVPIMHNNYFGLAATLLALLGIIRGDKRWRFAIGGAVLLYLLLAFGRYTPVYAWFHLHVPVFNIFRYPMRQLAFFTFFAVIASALGFDYIARRLRENPPSLQSAAVVFCAAVAVMWGLSWWLWPLALDNLGRGISGQLREPVLHFVRVRGVQWLLVNLAAGTILLFAARRRLSPQLAAVLFFTVLLLDYWKTNIDTTPYGKHGVFAKPPLAKTAIWPQGRPPLGKFRTFRQDAIYVDTDPGRMDWPKLERQLQWEWDTMLGNLGILEGFEDVMGYSPSSLAEGLTLQSQYFTRQDLLELFNVQYLVSPANAPPLYGVATLEILRDPRKNVMVRRLTNAWPRAYWVGAARYAANESAALAMVKSTDFRQRVIITTAGRFPDEKPAGESMVPAEIVSYEPDRVVVRSAAPAPGWLVLSDRHYPGWSAQVDGEPAEIMVANVLVRAVRLPPGAHEVVFEYHNRRLRWGALISGPAWIAVMLVWVVAWHKSRP